MAQKISEIINGPIPTLVDFHAVWCGPCQYQGPILEQFAQETGSKARIVKVDIDQNPAFADKYKVQSVPTLILFKNGEIKWRAVGVQQISQLRQALEAAA